MMKRERFGLRAAVLCALMLTACGRDPVRPDDEPIDLAAGRPATEPDAPADAPAIPPPFDFESHHAAVLELAPAHHAGMARVRAAVQAREAYEQEHRRATPERAVIADALDTLEAAVAAREAELQAVFAADSDWQQLRTEIRRRQDTIDALRGPLATRLDALTDASEPDPELEAELARLREQGRALNALREARQAREAELTWMITSAQEAAEAIERKRDEIADAKAQLTAQYAEDEAWQSLDAEVRAALAERDEARREIVTLIQQRMRYQAEREQARRAIEGDAVDRTDI